MPNLDSNIPSDIYNGFKVSEILRFTRTISKSSAFIRLSNQRIQKHGSKCRSIIFMFNKIFGKRFKVVQVFAETSDNFIKPFFLHRAGTVHANYCLLYDCFFICSFVCFHSWDNTTICLLSIICFYVYAFFLFVWVDIFYFSYFLESIFLYIYKFRVIISVWC